MKQLTLLFLSTMFMGQLVFAQQSYVQINPYAGWSTSSALQLYYGKARTTDGINFGGNLSFGKGISGEGFTQNAFLELQYNYLNTDLEYRSYDGGADVGFGKISMHNAMIGGTKGGGNGTVEGYGGTYLGATIFDPEESTFNTQTRFTLSFALGLKYAMNPRMGLRLHAQMYMPIWGSDFYLGWSPGGGTSTGVMATAVNVYANFNLGLYFNVGGGE